MSVTVESSFSDDLTLARQLAALASEVALDYFHRGVSTEFKPDGTPVSQADIEIERSLVDFLARHRPGDSVLGEELGALGGSSRRWLFDPIDGTSNFAAGSSQWGTHVALQYEQQIVLGIITRPVLGLSWWACRGCGAYRTGISESSDAVRLHVSTKSILMASRVTMWAHEGDPMVARLKHSTTWVEPDLDAILRLAEGELEAVVDRLGKPWDHAPAVALVREAGGTFSDSQGGHRIDLGEGRYTNSLVHDQFEALLGE
jgi:histidinol-phosphatase